MDTFVSNTHSTDSQVINSPASQPISHSASIQESECSIRLAAGLVRCVFLHYFHYFLRTVSAAQLPRIPHLHGNSGIYYSSIRHFFQHIGFVSARFFQKTQQALQYYLQCCNPSLLFSFDSSSRDFLLSSLVQLIGFLDFLIRPREITVKLDTDSSLEETHLEQLFPPVIDITSISKLNFTIESPRSDALFDHLLSPFITTLLEKPLFVTSQVLSLSFDKLNWADVQSVMCAFPSVLVLECVDIQWDTRDEWLSLSSILTLRTIKLEFDVYITYQNLQLLMDSIKDNPTLIQLSIIAQFNSSNHRITNELANLYRFCVNSNRRVFLKNGRNGAVLVDTVSHFFNFYTIPHQTDSISFFNDCRLDECCFTYRGNRGESQLFMSSLAMYCLERVFPDLISVTNLKKQCIIDFLELFQLNNSSGRNCSFNFNFVTKSCRYRQVLNRDFNLQNSTAIIDFFNLMVSLNLQFLLTIGYGIDDRCFFKLDTFNNIIYCDFKDTVSSVDDVTVDDVTNGDCCTGGMTFASFVSRHLHSESTKTGTKTGSV
ncbi:hypothetical protein GEMRC1_000611 [Eukaryota sp. GEM-RC1]